RKRRWLAAAATAAFLVAHVATLTSTGVPYVGPLAFLVTCLLAWEFGFRAALAWVILFTVGTPAVLTPLGFGLLVRFPEVRGFLLVLVAATAVAQVALAYLTARTRSLTDQLQDSRAALLEANEELTSALGEVKELRGFLPICAWCKAIRDVTGNWEK